MTRIAWLAMCALSAAWGQTINGDWVIEYRRLDARGYSRVSFQQNGEALTGTLAGKPLKGSVRGNSIEFEGSDDGQPVQVKGTLAAAGGSGTAMQNKEELTWKMWREAARPASPRVHAFEPTEFHRLFSGSIKPALRIFPGDTVKTWTVDAGGWDAAGKKRSNGGNPETGPFYIEGALPGDAIAVKLNRVRLNRDTAISGDTVVPTALNPGYYARQEKVKDFNSDWTLDRVNMVGRMAKPTEKMKNFTVPLHPMMGCIGVAPPREMVFRTGFLGAFGGNMDYNQVREGVTVYLPVFEPGALLFIGDGHATQGDGELTGDALETSMDVEFTVELIRGGGRNQSMPRIESDEAVMTSGIAGSLQEALQTATTEMSRYLAANYGLNAAETGSVLGPWMRYDIAEVVDPQFHVVARLSRKALAGLTPVAKK